jgi:cobalamin biosynthesis protein CbiG
VTYAVRTSVPVIAKPAKAYNLKPAEPPREEMSSISEIAYQLKGVLGEEKASLWECGSPQAAITRFHGFCSTSTFAFDT